MDSFADFREIDIPLIISFEIGRPLLQSSKWHSQRLQFRKNPFSDKPTKESIRIFLPDYKWLGTLNQMHIKIVNTSLWKGLENLCIFGILYINQDWNLWSSFFQSVENWLLIFQIKMLSMHRVLKFQIYRKNISLFI